MKRILIVVAVMAIILAGTSAAARAFRADSVVAHAPLPAAPGCQIFPTNNVWNADISHLPVAASSGAMIQSIGLTTGLHPDFGSFAGYGIPFNVVSGTQAKSPVTFTYADESDPGPYPIPANPQIEAGGDAHMLMVDKDHCYLYELYGVSQTGGQWSAGSGAIWNLNSNALRPDTWTSADAAGLPILPGLARYDEYTRGIIDHALRFTAVHSRNMHIYPARHDAGVTNAAYPPLGLRVRLKASVDISGFSPQAKVILQALKTYGMILADNGSNWYISGASDPRWDDNDLHNLGQIKGSSFEVVDTSGLLNGPDPTSTPTPHGSATATSTRTPVPPTATATRTRVPPTSTPTRTPVRPTATASRTSLPATPTSTRTPVRLTPTSTSTRPPSSPTPTRTPAPPTPTATTVKTNTKVLTLMIATGTQPLDRQANQYNAREAASSGPTLVLTTR